MTHWLVASTLGALSLAACGAEDQPRQQARPEAASPPAGAVHSEHVAIDGAGPMLEGTLYLPPGDGPHPGVVMVQGAGDRQRGQWPYRPVAESLARAGWASLVYDKRGVGRSEGEYDEGEDLYVLASDAMRALTVARRHPEIDADRVGLWGRSQGAWVIAAAAEMDGDASFLILEVGGGVTGLEQNVYQRERRMEAVGVPEDARAAVASIQRALWNYYISGEGVEDARRLVADGRDRGLLPRLGAFVPGVREGSPVPGPEWVAAERDGILRWFNRHLTFDPLPHLLRLDVPVLAVFGTADRLTPTGASIRRLEDEAFTGPRSSLLTVAAFDGADHALCPETPGEVIVPDCTFVAGYPDVVASWLSELTLERATTRGR